MLGFSVWGFRVLWLRVLGLLGFSGLGLRGFHTGVFNIGCQVKAADESCVGDAIGTGDSQNRASGNLKP